MPRSGLLFNPLLVWLIRVADMYVDCVGVGHSPIQSQTPAGHQAEKSQSYWGVCYLVCRGLEECSEACRDREVRVLGKSYRVF